MSGWLLKEERDTIGADYQDFRFRAYVGPPRELVRQAQLKRDTPLDITGVTKLTSNLNSDDTTINVASTDGFPAAGGFFIGTEFIRYTDKTDTTFTGLTRTNPVYHLEGAIVAQFKDITNRVYGLNLAGTIEQHEFAATVTGQDYDHLLLQPDRSMYFEVSYYPAFGHQGPRINDGFSSVDASAVSSLFTLEDEDGNTVEPRGMSWSDDGKLWVCTNNDLLIKIDPLSGEVLETVSHSLVNLEGVAYQEGGLWVTTQSLIGNSTVRKIDPSSGLTLVQFNVPAQTAGLAHDGEFLYVVDLNLLTIRRYNSLGILDNTISSPDPVPGGMSYWDGDLFVIGVNTGRLYRIDKENGTVYAQYETGISSPEALAISQFGGRIGSAGDDSIYKLSVAAREGTEGSRPTTTTSELFTLPTGVTGATYDDVGALWVTLDSGTIAELDRETGTVLSSFSSPVIGLTAIAHDGNNRVWVGSSSGTPKKLWRIEVGPNSVDASFEIPDTAVGLDFQDNQLWVLTAAGNIYRYDTDGFQADAFIRELDDPGALTKLGDKLYIVDGTLLKKYDTSLVVLDRAIDLPAAVTDPQGVVMSSAYGHRIADGTSGTVYRLTVTEAQDTQQESGGWSEWLPFYFGYIEGGSIDADYLEKTWSLRCRSTWMYLGEEEAAGRNLAPSIISRFRPVTCSSVLSDPALEIGIEYISTPGEGIGCQNIVDDDLTTVWISQDRPVLEEGPDPMPLPIYGCSPNSTSVSTLREALSDSSDPNTRIYLQPDHMDRFPFEGWIVIDADTANEEFIQYTLKVGKRSFFGTQPTESYLSGLTRSDPKSHVAFSPVSARGTDICGIEAPTKSDGTGSCWGVVPYGLNPRTGVGTGRQVPPWAGEGIPGNLERRLIFTEVHRPRAGLRPEYNWWIDLRNMSDRDHASVLNRNRDGTVRSVRDRGQGFLVIKWRDQDGIDQAKNIPLMHLALAQNLDVGPEVTTPPGVTSNCEKGWLVIVADRREFNRWWQVDTDVAVLELSVTDTYDGSVRPPTGGQKLSLDFNHGELKYYWYNNWWQYHTYDENDPAEAGWQAFVEYDVTPEQTEIQVRDVSVYPEHGWGWIHVTGDNEQHYEWIKWSGKRTDNFLGPATQFSTGVLENVERGYEGTTPRFWRGYWIAGSELARPVELVAAARVIVGYALPDPNNPGDTTSIYGNSNWKLSDWVRFQDLRDLRVGVGRSFQRDGDNNWDWITSSTPQPGKKYKTGRNEWFSVDLGEIDPPTSLSAVDTTDSQVRLTGATANLLNSGVVLIDQEFIKYESVNRNATAIAPTITAILEGVTRGWDGTSAAQHEEGTQVWQVFDRHALVEHLVSGVSFHRKADAGDGIPTHYRIYTAWRQTPRYPNTQGWESDWDLIWSVAGNTQKNRGHFIQEFADLDSGADSTRPPGTFGFHAARHVMMVIDQTDAGRAKMNEFRVYSTNPRLNLLAGSLDRETADDDEVTEIQNSIAVFFDYMVRGFGMESEEVSVIGTGVNFFELPISGGTYQSILTQLANNTGYKVWFNRFNQLFFVPDPSTRRSMPVMTNLDANMLRGNIGIVSKPSGRVSQVTIYFRDELSDETFAVSYPETPRGIGKPLEFDGLVVASSEEAKELARQKFAQENGEWEITANLGVGHHFILGHRYTLTYADWEATGTYFQGQNFYVSGITFNITMGPERRWDTTLTLSEYHVSN